MHGGGAEVLTPLCLMEAHPVHGRLRRRRPLQMNVAPMLDGLLLGPCLVSVGVTDAAAILPIMNLLRRIFRRLGRCMLLFL